MWLFIGPASALKDVGKRLDGVFFEFDPKAYISQT
jgi:hypothetical protein